MSPGRNGRYNMPKKLQELTHPLIISRYQKQGFDDFFCKPNLAPNEKLCKYRYCYYKLYSDLTSCDSYCYCLLAYCRYIRLIMCIYRYIRM